MCLWISSTAAKATPSVNSSGFFDNKRYGLLVIKNHLGFEACFILCLHTADQQQFGVQQSVGIALKGLKIAKTARRSNVQALFS